MKKLLLIILIFFSVNSFANLNGLPSSLNSAFNFSVESLSKNHYVAKWNLAKGVFLYQNKIKIAALNSTGAIKDIRLPKTTIKHFDSYFGNSLVYKDKIQVPFSLAGVSSNKTKVTVSYQGCSDQGVCFAPQTKTILLASTPSSMPPSHQSHYENVLSHSNLAWSILVFLGIGLLLAFTPCVLPMIPILSGIITGQKDCSTKKAFKLSLVYVLSMAMTYAIIGMVAGLVGSSLQTLLQQTWIIILMSALFFVLALSMFGLFQLKLPSKFENKLNNISNNQRGGSYIGVAVMGFLATLIVSPCVSPPLIGALTYISQSGNFILGGIALFSMGMGMGIPLIIIGTTNGALLPKAGAWMNTIKNISGIMLLGVVVWMLSRIIPALAISFIVALMLITIAIYSGALTFKQRSTGLLKLQHALSFILLLYGASLMIGTLRGNSSLWEPLSPEDTIASQAQVMATTQNTQNKFKVVESPSSLINALLLAKQQHKPAVVDFSAAWCPDCQYMLHHTFTNPEVIKALSKFVLIRADITKSNSKTRQMMKQFKIIGPPEMFFYDSNGKMLAYPRIVGLTKADSLLKQMAVL